MQTEKASRQKLILETAQRRFGMFGTEKTTMREIADDLNMSKASLYYYFPDKESLYRAVVEKETDEFVAGITRKMESISGADKLLVEYVKSRLSYFRTLLNLSRERVQLYRDLRPIIKETINIFREKEKTILVQIIAKGINDKIFFCENAEQAAGIYLDILRGLRMTMLNEKKFLALEEGEYEQLLEKTLIVTDIFIKGLKYKTL